jgi:hypothetical protein
MHHSILSLLIARKKNGQRSCPCTRKKIETGLLLLF